MTVSEQRFLERVPNLLSDIASVLKSIDESLKAIAKREQE